MDSPATNRVAVRSSVIDYFKACSLAGAQIPKEQLREKISMAQYLRLAIRDAIRSKNIDAGRPHYDAGFFGCADPVHTPLVVFINSKSGGRHGPKLKTRLQDLINQEQVPLCHTHTHIHIQLHFIRTFALYVTHIR